MFAFPPREEQTVRQRMHCFLIHHIRRRGVNVPLDVTSANVQNDLLQIVNHASHLDPAIEALGNKDKGPHMMRQAIREELYGFLRGAAANRDYFGI